MLTKKSKTVIFILEEFNQKKVPYCIARNYQNFPDFKSDLDIFYIGHLNEIKKILIRTAKKFNWDYLIYNDKMSKNFLNKNKIEIFYFYDHKKNNFLQVDFFRSMLVLGTPYYIFENKNTEKIKKKYNILPKKITNTYHLFQISSLLPININNIKKIKRYKFRFLNLDIKKIYKKNVLFENFLLAKMRKTLKLNNYKLFNIFAYIYKFQIFFKYYLMNPLKIYEFLLRIYEYYLLYIKQQSGFSIDIRNEKNIKKNIEKCFNKLKNIKVIDNWNYKSEIKFLKRFKFLERRNVLITLDQSFKKKDIKKTFLIKFLDYYELLYKKKYSHEYQRYK